MNKLKTNNILIEKYKNMLQNQDSEQDYWLRTAIDIYKIGHNSIRLLEWLIFCGRSYYDNKIFFLIY